MLRHIPTVEVFADDEYEKFFASIGEPDTPAERGRYDSSRNLAVVRSHEDAVVVESVLVHELVHGLQAQRLPAIFEIPPRNDEEVRARKELMEGDASRIQLALHEDFVRQGRLSAQVAKAAARNPPLGRRFATDVYRLGGQAALDAAFNGEPLTLDLLRSPSTFAAMVDFERLALGGTPLPSLPGQPPIDAPASWCR